MIWRLGVILAALLIGGPAAALEFVFTHADCRADDPAPCILGLPVGMVETCSGAPDAELWPFMRVEARVGDYVNDYAYAESIAWWITYAVRDMLRDRGLTQLANPVWPVGHGRMETWGPDDLARRGWHPGDRIAFLVRLKEPDMALPEGLPVVRLPVFCRAWAEQVGAARDAAPPAGVWVADDLPAPAGDARPSCPAEDFAPAADGPASVTVFDRSGNWIRSFPRIRVPPGSAAISIGLDPAFVDVRTDHRDVLLGTYEWDPPMMTTVSSNGHRQRLLVMALTDDRLVTRRINGPEFLFQTRSYRRCDPGVPVDGLAGLFGR